MKSDSDELLMARVLRSDRQSLEKLVRRYASPLLTFLVRMVGNRHVAEELFQDVFLTVWSKRSQYDTARPFRPWVFTIAANRCREELRKKRPQAAEELEDSPELENRDPTQDATAGLPMWGSPLLTAIQAEHAKLVAQALQSLPESQRTVVSLRVWNSLSFRDIAEIVGAPEGTVRSQMSRGLQALKQQLEPLIQT